MMSNRGTKWKLIVYSSPVPRKTYYCFSIYILKWVQFCHLRRRSSCCLLIEPNARRHQNLLFAYLLSLLYSCLSSFFFFDVSLFFTPPLSLLFLLFLLSASFPLSSLILSNISTNQIMILHLRQKNWYICKMNCLIFSFCYLFLLLDDKSDFQYS